MVQKDLEKKIPSMMAKAIRRSAKEACCRLHHISAHFALVLTAGIVSIALNRVKHLVVVFDVHVNQQ
jgi:hypothetical protein